MLLRWSRLRASSAFSLHSAPVKVRSADYFISYQKNRRPSSTSTSNTPSNTSSTITGTESQVEHLSKKPPVYEDDEEPNSNKSKFRVFWDRYGLVFIGTYFTLYFGTLGALYVAFSKGWAGSVDVLQFAKYFGLEESVANVNPKTAHFTLAWVATKFTEPLRLGGAVLITPPLARLFGRSPPSQRQIRKMFEKKHIE